MPLSRGAPPSAATEGGWDGGDPVELSEYAPLTAEDDQIPASGGLQRLQRMSPDNGAPPPAAPADRTMIQTGRVNRVFRVSFTPDATHLVHAGDKQVSFWNLRTGNRAVMRHTSTIRGFSLSFDGRWLCAATQAGLSVHSLPDFSNDDEEPVVCQKLWEVEPGTGFWDAAFSHDSRIVASVRADTGLVEVWDAQTGRLLQSVPDFSAGPNADCPALDFSKTLLAAGGRDTFREEVWLFEVTKLADPLLSRLQPFKKIKLGSSCSRLAFNQRGTRLAVGTGEPANLLIYSATENWERPLRLGTNEGRVNKLLNSLAFSHDDRLLCAGYYPSDMFAIWDIGAEVCVRSIHRPGTWGCACAFSPAADLLVTGGGNAPLVLHEMLPRQLTTSVMMPHDGQVEHAASAAELTALSSGSRLCVVQRVDGKLLRELSTEADIHLLELQPSGDQVAVAMWKTESVCLYDVHTGEPLKLIGTFEGRMYSLQYSPDGSQVVVAGSFGWKFYSAETGRELQTNVSTGTDAAVAGRRDTQWYCTYLDDCVVMCHAKRSGPFKLCQLMHA